MDALDIKFQDEVVRDFFHDHPDTLMGSSPKSTSNASFEAGRIFSDALQDVRRVQVLLV
jgi:hypothetical protein